MGSDRQADRRDRRVLPHNLDAEASILGGVLLRNEVLAVLPYLEPEDFYSPQHRAVFSAIRALEARAQPVDVVTLENELEQEGRLDAIGGVAFLGELALKVPTVENVEAYAKLVIDYRVRRDVMTRLSDIIESGYHGDKDGAALIEDATMALMTVRTGGEVRVTTMGVLAREEGERLLRDVEARESGKAVYTGVPTGITAIDERIGGHPEGVMTIYAARPGQGKTTSAMMSAAAAKRIADMDTLLISVEDSARSFGQRSLAQESGISTERIRARKIARDDITAIVRGMAHAQKARTESFVHFPGEEVEAIVRLVRRENMKRVMSGKPRLRQVVVDYLQKIVFPRWARTSEQAVRHISNTLSRLAETDGIAVVSMVQIGRKVEERDDHMPTLSDLSDSDQLGKDGKLIFGVHHPWSYDHDAAPEHLWQLGVIKNANGRSQFTIDLYWDRETHSIYDSELDYQQARIARRYQ